MYNNSMPKARFPASVEELFSTGIYDGVRIKYVSWDRTTELKGLANRRGFKCGCKECSYSKVLTATEFERHAGWNTGHPHHHIYFKNGRSMFECVMDIHALSLSDLLLLCLEALSICAT